MTDTTEAERDRHNALYDAKLKRERARDAVVEAAVKWFVRHGHGDTTLDLEDAVRAYLEAKGDEPSLDETTNPR